MPKPTKTARGSSTKAGLEFKSVAQFFAENKAIAGFQNVGKNLYMTVRELAENALDAAEAVPTHPDVDVTLEELTMADVNAMRNEVHDNPRKIAETLLRSGASELAPTNGTISEPMEDVEGDTARPKAKEKEKELFWRVTCTDNGVGMPHEEISSMLARVLAGTKYGIRQTRGKFGLGVKMVLVWALESSNIPVAVRSCTGHGNVSTCLLDIDLKRNQPKVLLDDSIEDNNVHRGTTIAVVVKGMLSHYYRRHLLQYFRRLAVVTPYADIELNLRGTHAADMGKYVFSQREEARVPPEPRSVLPHASCISHHNLGDALQSSKAKKLDYVIRQAYQGISTQLSREIIAQLVEEIGPEVTEKLPSELSEREIVKLTNVMKHFLDRFSPPDATCLSPVGEYNFRLGVMKEYKPRLVATVTMPAGVCQGHAFVVEAAVAIGGPKSGIHIIRFANRIPLLFEEGNDVVTRVANSDINWTSYKIKPKDHGVMIFVSLVSTKIPFTETGKEYISYDTVEIREKVRGALQACCKQLRTKLHGEASSKDKQKKQKDLMRYVGDVSRAVGGLMDSISARHADAVPTDEAGFIETVVASGGGKPTWTADAFSATLDDWRNGGSTEGLLEKRLGDYVRTIHVDDALGYTGAKHHNETEAVFWPPREWKSGKRVKLTQVAHPNCMIQLANKLE